MRLIILEQRDEESLCSQTETINMKMEKITQRRTSQRLHSTNLNIRMINQQELDGLNS
jgi:hypothetical protein